MSPWKQPPRGSRPVPGAGGQALQQSLLLPFQNTACQLVESHLLWKQLFPATNVAPPWAFVSTHACHGKSRRPGLTSLPSPSVCCPHPHLAPPFACFQGFEMKAAPVPSFPPQTLCLPTLCPRPRDKGT